jgi:hypothetical protein
MRQKDEFTGGNISSTQQQDFKIDNIRKNIFGLAAGLDFNYNNLVLGFRAGFDLNNNSDNENLATPHYKNLWQQLTVGYRF